MSKRETDGRTKAELAKALQFQGDLDNFIFRIRGRNEEVASNSIIILIYDLSLCPKVTDDFVTVDTFFTIPRSALCEHQLEFIATKKSK